MAKKGTSAVPPVGHSGPSTVKARLLEVATKVRQVPGSLKDGPDLLHRGWIVFGRLTREAYEVGAWKRDGSLIGDRLRLALTSVGRDDPEWLAGEEVPIWVLDAWGASVGTLTSHLRSPTGEKESVEFEAGILADEIEREANRISAPSSEQWSHGRTRKEWSKVFRVSVATFDRRRRDGSITWKPLGKLIQVDVSSLPKDEAK